MSGIVGIFYPDGRPVDLSHVERMVDILAHRGPDGAQVWCEGAIGFGHRMLWTTPESLLETLPLAKRGLVITADARIDNREALIAALGLNSYPAEKITDSEIILSAYEKWGEGCPEQLLGDFAFAIWDARRQTLFCARDCFGIKPFYYFYRSHSAFVFGSEIKALLSIPVVPQQINETRIAEYLASLTDDQQITFYDSIYRLLPGHSVTITPAGFNLQRYWALNPNREIRLSKDEDYVEAFREVFTEAVRCRLRSAYPVGTTLSGGLDSSSVFCTAHSLLQDQHSHPLHTFSTIYDTAKECDERPFIQAALHGRSAESTYVQADHLSVLQDKEQLFHYHDQPLEIYNHFMWWAMYQNAHQKGVRVMLDGEDGDTVVSYGRGYLRELAYADRWDVFAHEAHALSEHFHNYGMAPTTYLERYGFPHLNQLAATGHWLNFFKASQQISNYFEIPVRQLWVEQGIKPILPNSIKQLWWRLKGYQPSNQSSFPLVNQDLVKRVDLESRVERQLEKRNIPVHTQRDEHYLGLISGLTSLIEEESDCIAAKFCLEKRHPFWDRRLVELSLALPPEQKLKNGWPRLIFRRAMEGILPESIQWRVGKSNLGSNFSRSMLTFERGLLEDIVLRKSHIVEPYVDLALVRKIYDRFLIEPMEHRAEILWKVTNLALWLQQRNRNNS